MLIPMTAIANPMTMSLRVSQRKKEVFWLFLKMKTVILLVIIRRSGCMPSSRPSGMITSTQITLPRTGPLQVPLFTTNSTIQSKKSFCFYAFVLGDGRLMSCRKRTTTAGSGPYWLGNLRRHLPVLAT